MKFRKKMLCSAIALAMGGSEGAWAQLTGSSTLAFDAGFTTVTGCSAGAVFTGSACTIGGSPVTLAEITDIGGSWFGMDFDGDSTIQAFEKTPISQFAPIHLGTVQLSSGQHTGIVDGSESPAIDNPWNFAGNTGMHTLMSPISVISDFGSTKTLDFSGWGLNWGNIGPGGAGGPSVPLGGTATIVCSTSSCSAGSTYVLDMAVHVPQVFTSTTYALHLEGAVGVSAVPLPAAAWLFGSGVVGLAGVARRRRNKKG